MDKCVVWVVCFYVSSLLEKFQSKLTKLHYLDKAEFENLQSFWQLKGFLYILCYSLCRAESAHREYFFFSALGLRYGRWAFSSYGAGFLLQNMGHRVDRFSSCIIRTSLVAVQGLSCSTSYVILVPRPGIEPLLHTLEYGFSIIGQPGKSLCYI